MICGVGVDLLMLTTLAWSEKLQGQIQDSP